MTETEGGGVPALAIRPGAPPSQADPPARPAAEGPRWALGRLVVVVALLTGIVGLFATVGADSRWLAALGRIIIARGAIPRGVPFAAASTAHWANTLVAAELIFDGLERALGDRGLVIADMVAVAFAFALLAWDARAQGAGSRPTATSLALVALGAFPSLAVVRVQLFSLVLFPVLVAVLRMESRNPSRRIWLVLPVLALWSNLHGAALSGLAVLWVYLALYRARREPWTAVAVAVSSLIAMCLTPAGIRTADYYYGLVTNVAAERGVGQWEPLGHSPFDWVMIAVLVILALRMRHRLPPLWECATIILLAALTVKAARDGVWLLFFLVAPSARAQRPGRDWHGLLPVGAVVAVALIAIDLVHPLHSPGAPKATVASAVRLADGSPILADPIPAEQIALVGGRIWSGNPLDAFSHRVQTEYVDWISGSAGGRAALDNGQIRIVLVTAGSSDAQVTAADPAFVRVAANSSTVLYERRPAKQ